VLGNRLKSWCRQYNIPSEYQAAYKTGVSCGDHVFALNSLIQMQFAKNQKLYACFVDLSSAFDTVPHEALWLKLETLGLTVKFLNILKFIYSQAYAVVRTRTSDTDPFPINVGVLQGETLSANLFTLYLDDVTSYIERNSLFGILVNSIRLVHMLLFADDIVLVSETMEGLQSKIDALSQYLEVNMLRVNLGKTKVIVFRKKGRLLKKDRFMWINESIEIVKEYTYLGVTFSSSGLFNIQAKRATSKSLSALNAVWEIFCKGRLKEQESRDCLYKSIVQSTLMYCSEVWGIGHDVELERVHQRYIKRLLRLPRNTPQYFARIETGNTHIKIEVIKRVFKFFHKVLKSPHGTLIRDCYEGLRNTSDVNESKYNWATQVRDLLIEVNLKNVWDAQCPDVLSNAYNDILERHQTSLLEHDLTRVNTSTSVPHLRHISTSWKRQCYLTLDMPLHVTSTICQIRLNYPVLYINFKFYKLGSYNATQCCHCSSGEVEDLNHIFSKCINYRDLRNEYRRLIDFNTIDCDYYVKIDSNLDVQSYMHVFQFISLCMKRRGGETQNNHC